MTYDIIKKNSHTDIRTSCLGQIVQPYK